MSASDAMMNHTYIVYNWKLSLDYFVTKKVSTGRRLERKLLVKLLVAWVLNTHCTEITAALQGSSSNTGRRLWANFIYQIIIDTYYSFCSWRF